MSVYYNENDPFAAAWLRELMKAGLIADGEVDERSIEDVKPNELAGYSQCHFFAGIGVWSYALRLTGIPDDYPVWTGSCPCQPFSAAGKGGGFDDERHLWPSWQWLIQQCRPATIIGEQVASKAVNPWIDLVQADLEAMGYAFGCVPFPSAGIGAPHIRDRAYWLANAQLSERRPSDQRRTVVYTEAGKRNKSSDWPGECGNAGGLADTPSTRPLSVPQPGVHSGEEGAGARHVELERLGAAGGLADANISEPKQLAGQRTRPGEAQSGRALDQHNGRSTLSDTRPAGPTNGYWRDADWLFCRDGKWRPVESGTFPLVDGTANRVGRLRGYGNAINAQAAAEFVRAAL